jgi:pimeloyl-ACP methyl ester carboxylesterase
MFVTNEGIQIHYETEGTGPALILRTGAGGDFRIWRDAGYVAGLKGCRKILIDQRGRGMSDRPSTVESHRYEHHISDIAAVLDDAGVESAAFLGYSAGAVMGIAFGIAHPTRLKALVGIGSLPFQNNSDQPKPGDVQAEIQRIVAAGGVRADVEMYMRQDNDRFPDPLHRNVLGGDPFMKALDTVAALDWHGPLDAYSNLRAPVLMLTGEREDNERTTEKAIERMPNGRVVHLRGIGHLSAFYRSDLTLPHILAFLREFFV